MILLIVTICLQADPVTIDCKSQVWRMDRTALACLELVKPTLAFIGDQSKGLPVVKIMAACKAGTLA